MADSNNIAENIRQIQQKISDCCTQYGRSASAVRLLAVSKTKSAELIRQAYAAGQKDFGESYLQEAVGKIHALEELDISWHFIGAIQSNKTRDIAQYFDWVHSVDRLKIARRLNEQRPAEQPPLNICLQVNISNESSKAGAAPEQLASLADKISQLSNIRLRGLMAIPIKADSLQQQRSIFRQMQQALNTLNTHGHQLDTLSMGMSNDMEAAIAEGSTMVRIGTAIFGARDPKPA
ncbi:MAG: YggS family pyridoxal phosphate-dependent enzyme [Gammaproteobacteria bacterium]|nr:YggS family pyridoxal phosphate-dependent enzyme [Gammaproteobacteria bacterium]